MRETVRLVVAVEGHVPLPGTEFEIGVDTVRHRIASSPPGTIARSMVTCSVVVRRDGEEIFREHVVEGDAVRFRHLMIRPVSILEETAEVEVTISC